MCPAGWKRTVRSPVQRERRVERDRRELLERPLRILLGVERQGRMVLREAVAVGEFRVLFLQEAAVGQQDPAQLVGQLGRMDAAAKAVLHEQGQVAAVIEMGVGEDHRVDAVRGDGHRRPVALPELLEALKQAAIDQDPAAAGLQQVFRAGHGPDAAEEGEVQGHRRIPAARRTLSLKAISPEGRFCYTVSGSGLRVVDIGQRPLVPDPPGAAGAARSVSASSSGSDGLIGRPGAELEAARRDQVGHDAEPPMQEGRVRRVRRAGLDDGIVGRIVEGRPEPIERAPQQRAELGERRVAGLREGGMVAPRQDPLLERARPPRRGRGPRSSRSPRRPACPRQARARSRRR